MSPLERAQPALAAAITRRGYTELTPVQNAILDDRLNDRDLLVSAQTGSGKTVAFGLAFGPSILPAMSDKARERPPLALIIAPTRELALQVRREFEWLYEDARASICSCVGGMDPRDERRALARGADIVVGTPGRLRDQITRGSLDLSGLRAVVLDEADEMLDLGFREDLEFILDAAPVERRTLMFSATLPREVTALAKRFQHDAERISVHSEKSQHADIEYVGHAVLPNERENAIINILRYHDASRSIVFCGTREHVKRLTSRLANRGFSTVALSGEFTQSERSHALQSIRDGRARICVATDVAARGIDLPELDLVVHADLPTNPETLLHRSGRTGRAGRKGVCALVVASNRQRSAERLVRGAKVKLTWTSPPSASDIATLDHERLLQSSYLQENPDSDERAPVDALLDAYSAEQIAAAFYRLSKSGLPAAEDLSDVGEREQKKTLRRDFEDGEWCSISAGRKQKAEPRWILPVICKSGGIDRKSVGSISIRETETLFEIHPDKVAPFWQTVSEQGCVERALTIQHIGEYRDQPSSGTSPTPDRPDKPRHKKRKPRRDGPPPRRSSEKFAKKTGKRANSAPKARSRKPKS